MRTPVLTVRFMSPGPYDDGSRYYKIFVDVDIHDTDNDEIPDDSGVRCPPSCPSTSYASDTAFHKVHLTSQTHAERLGNPQATNTLDPFYGVKIQWSDGDLDLATYEEGVKVLRKIDRYLDRVRQSAGYTRSFGEFVLRLGRAMGIRKAYVPRPDGLNPYVDLDYASTLIDRQIGEWMAKWRPNHHDVTGVA